MNGGKCRLKLVTVHRTVDEDILEWILIKISHFTSKELSFIKR